MKIGTKHTMNQDLTPKQFLQEIREIILQFPNSRNPMIDDTCLYKSKDGSMCLIGTWLISKKEIPYSYNWEGKSALPVLSELGFNEQVSNLAENVQVEADELAIDESWKDLLPTIDIFESKV